MNQKQADEVLQKARPYLKDFIEEQRRRHEPTATEVLGVLIHPTQPSWRRTGQLNHYVVAGQRNVEKYANLTVTPHIGRLDYTTYFYFTVEQIMAEAKTLEMIW